jgi:hypothetical protein
MNDSSADALAERVDRLERENRYWRRGGVLVVAVLSLLVLATLHRPRPLAAHQRSADRSPVILKFGGYYLNADAITYINFQSEKEKAGTLVYFAGDTRTPLQLSRQNGEMMRPWLDGHSFDLTAEPSKEPAPKGFPKVSVPDR